MSLDKNLVQSLVEITSKAAISCYPHIGKENKNIELLINEIKKKLENKFISSNDIIITRSRHRDNIEKCIYYLKAFQNKNSEEEFDKAAEDLRLAVRHLGLIVGKVDVEEILGSIFNDFCIGK